MDGFKNISINLRSLFQNNKEKVLTTLMVLFVMQIGVIGFMEWRYSQLKRQSTSSQNSQLVVPLPSTTPINEAENKYHDWKLYTNDKFGFSMKYPQDLDLKAEEIDIKAKQADYNHQCSVGLIEGCGGSRWPDFQIGFVNSDNKLLFEMNIHQIALTSSLYEGVLIRDNFTYQLSTGSYRFDVQNEFELESIDQAVLSAIKETIQFYKPTRPLVCLWDEAAVGFDPVEDKDLIQKMTSIPSSLELVQVNGYAHDVSRKSCKEVSYLVWNAQVETEGPPFDTLETCFSTCSQ